MDCSINISIAITYLDVTIWPDVDCVANCTTTISIVADADYTTAVNLDTSSVYLVV